MDSSGMEVLCKNSTFGCTFASSCAEDMVDHFQGDCAFHPVQCFKCSKIVPKMNFAKHYEQCCKDSSASQCPPPEEAHDVAETKACRTTSMKQPSSVQECVTECKLNADKLSSDVKDVAAQVKVMTEKQQDLEAIVKGQGDVIQELCKSISVVVEKVDKVQEGVSGLVNRLEKDAGTIVESVENVDCSVKQSVKESKLGVERLSRAIRDVAVDVAEVKLVRQEQDLEASVKQQGDFMKELKRSITTTAEKVNEVEQGVGTIVRRVEKVGGLVYMLEKDVGTIMERVESVDGLVKECAKESKLGVKSLSRVMNDVAADVADVKVIKEKQEDMEASLKQQGDLMKELGSNILMNAEKVNEVKQGVGTIVQRVENVDGLVKEVRALTGPLAGQSKIHWYVENVSQYIEKGNTEPSRVGSNLFVIRGYSAKLLFKVQKWETRQYMGLFFHLYRGPRDSMLQWPFRIPYTLSLIHPNDASKTMQFKMTPASTDPQSFEKPKSEANTGRGTPGLCIVEEAQNEGFIENDAVCFALTLHE